MDLPDILQMFSLDGQVAMVTGGGRGIGKAIAVGFAKAGAHVAIVARTRAEIEASAADVRALGRTAMAIESDVSTADDVGRAVRQITGTFGSVDILVNSAGGAHFVADPADIREEGWDKGISQNLRSVFLVSQAVGRVMIQQGRGKIINITSALDVRFSPEVAYYAAGKAGVNALTKTLAAAWGPKGIYVNAIALGRIETALSKLRREGRQRRGLPPDDKPLFPRHRPPVGEGHGEPEDVVPLAIFLASPASDYLTGAIIGLGEAGLLPSLG